MENTYVLDVFETQPAYAGPASLTEHQSLEKKWLPVWYGFGLIRARKQSIKKQNSNHQSTASLQTLYSSCMSYELGLAVGTICVASQGRRPLHQVHLP